ncbi:MAG: DUF1080 domain-containing protein [Pirellulales bacterium]|nr:DUF1080 domain-containing protein [Pirellulales bacterium]
MDSRLIGRFVGSLFAVLVVAPFAWAGESVELFNGKDFTGWTKRGGAATYRVDHGEVVGTSAPNTVNTFLCTDKDYGDFELEYDFKIADRNFNSGVQIRSHYRPEKGKDRVYGYQVEIDPKADRAWSGGLYYEGGRLDDAATKNKGKVVWLRGAGWLDDLSDNEAARKSFKFGEWNHIRVRAQGRQIQTWINGVPAADYTDNDEKAFSPSGLIALQVHAVGKEKDPKEIRWRNIKLKTL